MLKITIPFLVTVIALLGLTSCSTEVPSADLWPDGAWILYDLSRLDTDGTQSSGTLKIAAVGKEMVDDAPYYWLEMREDNQDGVTITKFLAREKTGFDPQNGFTFWGDIKRIIIQKNTDTPEEIPAQHLKRFAPTFIESTKSNRFGNAEDLEAPEYKDLETKTFVINEKEFPCSGKRSTRKYKSSINLGFLNLEDTTEAVSEYYRSSELPFAGIVQIVHNSVTTSQNKLKTEEPPKPPMKWQVSLVARQFGTSGAQSQVIGEPVEKQVLPFPFLNAGQNK